MSAGICNNETISVIAKAFVIYNIEYKADDYKEPMYFTSDGLMYFTPSETIIKIGQSLVNQNFASVYYRYKENNKPDTFKYKDIPLTEGLIFGCLRNYIYEACETPDFYKSDIYYSAERLLDFLLRTLLKKEKQVAPWGYGGHNILR